MMDLIIVLSFSGLLILSTWVKDMEVYVKDAEMTMGEVFVASMELTDKLKKCEKRKKR